ncbi:MAG: CoB--CoM heterodisulfide reductase iron-sulfur subunit B family protein [Anaerolineae bacterium]
MALFPGCLVLQRMPQYEKAGKRVLRELDISVASIAYAACCGAPLESFTDKWLYLAAYNLSLAERMGFPVLTLCGNCTSSLLRADVALRDPSHRLLVNDKLDEIGLHFEGGTRVIHLVQVLSEQLEGLRDTVRAELSLKVALTHPCQAFRPHEVLGFDDPLQPQAMRSIVELTGAEVVPYDAEYDCCGSTLYLVNEQLGLEAGQRKLSSAAGADVLVDACGNCQLLLERFQGLMNEGRAESKMPVLTLPQLLGLAMGIDPAELGVGPVMAGKLLGSSP